MNKAFVDYYEVLQSNRSAEIEEIKRNYQRLVLLYHPDKINKGEKSDIDFQLIQKAWNTLRDPSERKHYDAMLACDEHSGLLVYDTVTLQDMEFNEQEGIYSFLCRCGGTYELDKVQSNSKSTLVLDCDECSFSIKVLL